MDAKRVQENFGTKKDGIPSSTMAVDRISKLPDLLIYHILSFVPTIDVVRMSILSRRWRCVWYLIPVLHFCDTDHMGRFHSHCQPRQAFYKFVDKCIKYREKSMRYVTNSVITGFKLHIDSYVDSAVLDNWLNFIVRRRAAELDLRTKPKDFENFRYYRLPEALLNARSLTVLKLDNLMFDSSCSVSLPSLVSLSLTRVAICDDALPNLLLGCPALEKFLLRKCYGLCNPHISSLTLKFLEIKGDETSTTMVVETKNLQSLLYDGSCQKINLSACKEITSLSLESMQDNKSLEDLIVGLPLLESLTLTELWNVEHFKICGQHLKSIRLGKYYELQGKAQVTIDAPNLVSFYYKGDAKFDISMNAQNNVLNGHIIINEWFTDEHMYDRDWYIDLIIFLSNINFSYNATVSLHVCSEEALIIPESLRKICRPPWPILKHLKVMTFHTLKRKRELRNSLYWVSPVLETLVIEHKIEGYPSD